VAALEAARRAGDPAAGSLAPGPDATELASIAGQLEASAAAGGAFAEMRHRATSIGSDLEAALDALDDGDLGAAEGRVAVARAAHDAVAGWEVGFVTLPVWIETTDEMIGAVERIVEATRDGDAAAADEAAADFAAVAGDGATADRALRIALSEGGSSMTSTPLTRLAGVLSAIGELRASVASVREAAAR
jgi:hypothetical protein